MMPYNLILFFFLKDQTYLYYVLSGANWYEAKRQLLRDAIRTYLANLTFCIHQLRKSYLIAPSAISVPAGQ
jgi:hypothetical protein